MKANQKIDEKQVVGIDFGNKQIHLIFGKRQVVAHNTLYLQNRNAYINKKLSHHCLQDLLYILGTKLDQKKIKTLWKYYHCTFIKGTNQNLLLNKGDWISNIQESHIQFWIAAIIRGLLLTNPHLRLFMYQKRPIQLIVTVFEGQINPFRLSLRKCFSMNDLNELFFVSSSHCLAAQYLKQTKKSRDDTEIIGVIDFGDRGLSVTVYKLYFMERGIVEVLCREVNRFGGLHLTSKLVDYVVEQLTKSHGMDISNNPKLMHKLKILCQEAKHTLSKHEKAFVRLDELPDINVYGCEISINQLEKCIEKEMTENIQLISKTIQQYAERMTKILVTGGSCNMLLFKREFQKIIYSRPNLKLVTPETDCITKGLLIIKGSTIRLLDIAPFDVNIEGDQNFKCLAIRKGESVPVRKKIAMKFPSGELTFSMKLYEDKTLIGSCFIPERPRQWNYNLYLQMDVNKIINIYGTTSFGLIKMSTNMLEILGEDSTKYVSFLQELDYHIEND